MNPPHYVEGGKNANGARILKGIEVIVKEIKAQGLYP